MKKFIVLGIGLAFFVTACSNNADNNARTSTEDSNYTESGNDAETEVNPDYDPHRGEGKFKDVEVGAFNPKLAQEGKSIYDMKCQSCHKLTDERLVGPGWKGITKKHSVDWILNFITNPDAMLDQDPELQKQLEICMVRMPNQNLTDADAKAVYEFMRENDGAK